MTIIDRYYREQLTATREGRADPRPLVAAWTRALRDSLAALRRGDMPWGDRSLLVSWGRLRRVRPALLSAESCSLIEEAAAVGDTLGGEALRAALGKFDSRSWTDAVRRFVDSYEEADRALVESQGRLARALIDRLDEAELTAYAAGYFSRGALGESELDEEGLKACRELLIAEVGAFLPAAEYVQAVGAALRPDLPEFDPMLAATAEKYIWLLDDAEDAQAEFSPRGGGFFTARAIREFLATVKAKRDVEPWRAPAMMKGWLPTAAYLIAAADRPAATGYPVYRWTSPDGAHVAYLTIPPTTRGADDERLCVEFRQAGPARSPASELAGTSVTLEGVPAKIDPQGMAFFRLGDLRAGESAEPVLAVGEPPVVWPLKSGERPDR